MIGVYVEIRDKMLRKRYRARIKGRRILVGRSKACHLRINSDMCSRVHAAMRLEDGAWSIEDMDSANGTYLNEQRIQTSSLKAGDEIRLAPRGLKIVILGLGTGRRAPAPPPDQKPAKKSKKGKKKTRKPAKQKARKPTKQKQPTPAPPRPAAPPGGAVARRGGVATWRWTIPLIGFLFGLSVGFDAWSGLIPAFPYTEVMAPITWMIRGVREVAPRMLLEIGPFLVRALLACWFLLFGLAVMRPRSRWKSVLVLVVLHGVAVAALLL